MTTLLPAWPPVLSEEQRAAVSLQCTDYAISHSILYRPLPIASSSKPPLDSAIHAPISLFPSPIPRFLYQKGQKLQPLYNDLYARIAVDDAFLKRVIGGNVILVDDFQKKLWELWKQVKKDGPVQLKQVEINTISSSFGPLCTRVSDLHRHLASSGAYDGISPLLSADHMPQNHALSTLASGLAAAHSAYLKASDLEKAYDAVILFVVQDGERNVFDQRLIEYELLERHQIHVERATFKQLEGAISVSGSSRNLYYTSAFNNTRHQVSVVYFRSGYSPTDYPSEKEWQTRLKIEQSFAIKCPTVALQLAGAKKVQQVLSNPNELEYFVKDSTKGKVWSDEDVAFLRESFMPMYGMESNSKGIEIASDKERAKNYVMKPQREGGGNNVYREAIPLELAKLEKLDQERGFEEVKRREGYILMKLIQPPSSVGNYLLRSGSGGVASSQQETLGAVLAKDVISELGVFGTILFQEAAEGGNGISKVVYEKSKGHLLRTKGRESDEGGVAVGYSVIDSPLLI